MNINTQHLDKSLQTLDTSLTLLKESKVDSAQYDVFLIASVKSFELSLEMSGKLLKKALRPYFSSSYKLEQLTFKSIFRTSARYGFMNEDEVQRWFSYRDNRNNTAHDYGEGFAKNTLLLIPSFLKDAKKLSKKISEIEY